MPHLGDIFFDCAEVAQLVKQCIRKAEGLFCWMLRILQLPLTDK